MYPDESSWVLVYWLEGHNMLEGCMYIGLWKYIWLYDKITFGSSLPFACLIALYVVLLLLRWSSISCLFICHPWVPLYQYGWFNQRVISGHHLEIERVMVLPTHVTDHWTWVQAWRSIGHSWYTTEIPGSMSPIYLMGTDARGTRGQQGRDNSAA